MCGLNNAYRLGCAGACGCGGSELSGVADYDHISIGGIQYSVNQILDKNIVANRDLKGYSNTTVGSNTVKKTFKKGQTIGMVYSYIKPNATNGGVAWLMFGTNFENTFFVPADGADIKTLQDQGALSVKQEVEKEQEEAEKNDNPIVYYFKKLAMPVLIGGAVVYGVVQLGKTVIEKKLK